MTVCRLCRHAVYAENINLRNCTVTFACRVECSTCYCTAAALCSVVTHVTQNKVMLCAYNDVILRWVKD